MNRHGEALLRVRYISLDAANRAWMHSAGYRDRGRDQHVMADGGITEVVSSKAHDQAMSIRHRQQFACGGNQKRK